MILPLSEKSASESLSDIAKLDILKLWEEKQLRITDVIQTALEVLYANGSVIGVVALQRGN